jgi:hypothetical protein
MSERFLLYLDILGFSDLKKSEIRTLYKTIDKLNVFSHAPYFKSIVFSDTILVYNSNKFRNIRERNSAIMWMCEFAQDLFYRLIGKDIHFRALLTVGDFEHYKLKNIEAFFGEALAAAHKHEKEISCTGLLMDNRLAGYSDIFKTTPYDDKYHFVHIMQTLGTISFLEAEYPISSELILPMGTEFLHAYDLKYLQNIHRHMTNINLHPRIRAKYMGTWQMLRSISAPLMDAFERSGFNPRSVCDFDWSEAMSRVGTPRGFHG